MTHYVEEVPDSLERGQIWKVCGFAQTAREGNETTKSFRGLGNSKERAEHAYGIWKELGFKGNPASPVSFYRKMYEKMRRRGDFNYRMNASVNFTLKQGFYGGWIEIMQNGFCAGPLYHYDVNKAYYWAGQEGLPTRVRPYSKGDANFMVLARIRSHKRDLPVMIEQRKRVLLTNEDIDLYGIDPEIITGVSWADDVERFYPESVMVEFAGKVPEWLFKKMTQTYWGIYAQHLPIDREVWENGKLQKTIRMYNRNQNIFWAQTLVSRVCRHVYGEAVKGARQVYVDSIIVPEPIATGEEIGNWRHVNTFPTGVIINAPGVWTPFPEGRRLHYNLWHKHAGYSDIQ